MQPTNNHPLSDSLIAEHWPDADTPGGRSEIRRQFDALMRQVRTSSSKPFPRHPEVMAPIVIEKARPLSERPDTVAMLVARIEELEALMGKAAANE